MPSAGVAGRAPLGARFVKGKRERLLARDFMIRVIVLMTLMPGERPGDVIAALAGDLALVPWARPWRPASGRAAGDWRNALGPVPLEELRDLVLGSAWREHQERGCPGAVTIGTKRPLKAGALDGTLLRVPDTPANRAFFGTVGTGDDSGPYPCLRALPLTCCSCRALFAMPHGPAGTGKAESEQALLDEAMACFPVLFAPDWIWLMDRNYYGAARIARMIRSTHVLIRLKSDIPLKRTSEILPDGSYRAELSGDGVTDRGPRHRVLRRRGRPGRARDVLPGHRPHGLGGLPRRGAGGPLQMAVGRVGDRAAGGQGGPARRRPGTGPMLRSGSPDLVRQELAAWAAATGMTRGVVLDAALAAVPAGKGRRAGHRVRPRDLSFARAVRAVLSAIRLGHACYQAVTSEIGRCRTIVDRDRHRARKSKSPSSFAHAGPADTITRIAPAVITMANTPA